MEDFQVITREPESPGSEGKKKLTNLYVNGKYKILASFYNFVHSAPTELPHFSLNPIVMLGKCYRNEDFPQKDQELQNSDLSNSSITNNHNEEETEDKYHNSTSNQLHEGRQRLAHIEAFLLDFSSLFWFTYRKDFAPLESAQLTTDSGWGCMLRTGQMMLAHMLTRHMLGREWRVSQQEQMSPYSSYRQILRWFSDSPSPKSPYSLHNFVARSKLLESKGNINKVGEWFTPTRVCLLMKSLVRKHSPEALTIYVSKDGVIYKQDVAALCTLTELYAEKSPPRQRRAQDDLTQDSLLFWRPVIILVPVRLGVDKINKLYISGVKALLNLPQSAGIIGGRPRQSLYFVGYQDEDVFFLDPHIVRSCTKQEDCMPESYHSSIPQKMPIENIDPSLAIGFYCSKKHDFEEFCAAVDEIAKQGNPIISIADQRPDYGEEDDEKELHDVVMI